MSMWGAGQVAGWSALCLLGALLLTALSMACASAALRGAPRSWTGVAAAVVMGAATLDMILTEVRLLHPLAWAGGLVGAALIALLDRRRRVAAAQHAASLLLMSVMWVVMAAPGEGSATAFAGHGAHGPAGVPTGWLVVAAAAVLTVIAVRVHRRRHGVRPIPERAVAAPGLSAHIVRLQHPSMSAGMLLMALGMAAPLG